TKFFLSNFRLKYTMNLFHLFSVSLLVLTFSGQPAPIADKSPEPVHIVSDTSISIKEETEEFIPWSYDKKLIWDDFHCEPVRGTDAVASTSTSLGIAYQMVNGQLSYHISCN